MRSISSAVGGRSSRPTTCSRTVAAPTNEATLGAIPRRSRWARYSASVVHSISYLKSPCWARARAFISGVSGPSDQPSPKISVVTPWRMSPCDRPSAISDSVAHESMFTKPGATARPRASTTVAAFALPRLPMAAMRSPRMPTSARRPGAPVPSYTVPPRSTTSKGGSGGAARSAAAISRALVRAYWSRRRVGAGASRNIRFRRQIGVVADVRVAHGGAGAEHPVRLPDLDDLAVGEGLRGLDARAAGPEVVGHRRFLAALPAVVVRLQHEEEDAVAPRRHAAVPLRRRRAHGRGEEEAGLVAPVATGRVLAQEADAHLAAGLHGRDHGVEAVGRRGEVEGAIPLGQRQGDVDGLAAQHRVRQLHRRAARGRVRRRRHLFPGLPVGILALDSDRKREAEARLAAPFPPSRGRRGLRAFAH